MSDKPIEIEFDNKEVHEKLLNLAKRTENLRPLMKKSQVFSRIQLKRILKKREDLTNGWIWQNRQKTEN